MRPIVFALCLAIASAFSSAAQWNPLGHELLPAELFLLNHSGEALTPEQAWRRFELGEFEARGNGFMENYGFTRAEQWMLVKPSNRFPTNSALCLGEPHINKIEVFESGEKWRSIYTTGDHLAFTSRPIFATNFAFPIQSGSTYLLRINKRNESLRLYAAVLPRDTISRQEGSQLLIPFVGVGAMLLMGVMMGYLFWRTRDRMYLWYMGYMLFGFGWILANSGLGFQYLWPDSPWFASRSRPLFMVGILHCAILFLKGFLQTQKPKWLLAAVWVFLAINGCLALPILLTPYNFSSHPQWIIFLQSSTLFFLAFMIFTLCWIAWEASKGKRSAIIYLLSIIPLLVFGFANMFYYNGWVTGLPFWWLQNGSTLGFLIEVVVLTMALVHRLESFRRDKLMAEEKLRRQEEQTVELLLNTKMAERMQIVDQLHDVAGSMLSAARLNLSAAMEMNEHRSVGEKLNWTAKALNSLSATIRNLSHALNPAFLQDSGFVASVENVVQVFAASGKMDIELTVDPQLQTALISRHVLTVLQHAVYELLNNVARHSGATKAWIDLGATSEHVWLRLGDDGYGQADELKKQFGAGLQRVQEKVEALGGQFLLDNRLPQGLLISVSIPLTED